jgi:hypothetical protein
MSDCQRIEAAWSQLKGDVKAEDFSPLVKILDEVNGGSHILKSNLIKQASDAAPAMDAKGVYTKELDSDVAGRAIVQQQHGKANTIALEEGGRSETVRLDEQGNPMLLDIYQNCGNKGFGVMSTLPEGKSSYRTYRLPDGIELTVDNDKPIKAKQY